MPVEKLANFLVLILLVEMMVAVGLSVLVRDVAGVLKDIGLVARAGLVNYVLVPAITIFLLHLFHSPPMVALGFLLAAVCPAAPLAPSLTALAKGNIHVSVGLMLILAASSAILAPLLLSFLSPRVASGANLKIDTVKIVTTLLMTQLLPLGVGLLVRSKRPALAEKLQKPANLLTGILSLVVFALIIALQYRTLAEIRTKGYVATRRAVGLTTAARNIGVALVIATASFPGTAAVTAVIVFAIFQTVLVALFALALGRLAPSS
jgi:BASS family bile acid:Na+ symporter